MYWKTKAAIFRALDAVPFGSSLHYFAQKKFTKTWPRPREDVAALVEMARLHVSDFQRLSKTPLSNATFLEIGAGRDLIVPIAMRMLGVGKVIAVDIDRLAKLDLVRAAATAAAELVGVDAPVLKSWSDVADFGVYYLAPLDVAKDATRLPAIDAFVSNEVLEHIPGNALHDVFNSVVGLMPPGGVSLHSIDYSDHYARGGGVSRHNFLQYSPSEWAPFNAGMHYVNRLRHSQYRPMMEIAGLRIVEERTHDEEIPHDLPLAEEFASFAPDDLRILRSRICAIKA